MSMSVHTNKSALVALQNLNKTNSELEDVQGRINTGLSVNTPPTTQRSGPSPKASGRTSGRSTRLR